MMYALGFRVTRVSRQLYHGRRARAKPEAKEPVLSHRFFVKIRQIHSSLTFSGQNLFLRNQARFAVTAQVHSPGTQLTYGEKIIYLPSDCLVNLRLWLPVPLSPEHGNRKREAIEQLNWCAGPGTAALLRRAILQS